MRLCTRNCFPMNGHLMILIVYHVGQSLSARDICIFPNLAIFLADSYTSSYSIYHSLHTSLRVLAR